MIVTISGGHSGIREYLETGQKKERGFTRDEADKRVTLGGDLEVTDSVIKSLDFKENYHHITLAFKEDIVSQEDLQKAYNEFEKFVKVAYKNEEINIYAEAHLPKLKSYKAKNGEIVIRKPHIHIVIPNVNMLTGKYMEPFGRVSNNTHYIDSFQELHNQNFGFESPKDNRRNGFDLDSSIMSRHTGELFGKNTVEKEEFLSFIIENKIDSYSKFEEYLKSQGSIRTRNQGKENEYLNIKLPHHSQGINLKEFCFSKEFIEEFDYSDKLDFLQKETENVFIEKKEKYESKKRAKHEELFKDWFDFRARELKYINYKSKFYKEVYKNASKVEKIELLNQKEKEFYQKNNIEEEIKEELKDYDSPMRIKENLKEIIKDKQNVKFKNTNTITRANERIYIAIAEQLGREFEAEDANSMRTLSESQLVHNAKRINELLHVDEVDKLEPKRRRKSNNQLRWANNGNSRVEESTRKTKREINNVIDSKLAAYFDKKELESTNFKRFLIKDTYDKLTELKGVLSQKYDYDEKRNVICLNNQTKRVIDVKEFIVEHMNLLADEIHALEKSIGKIEIDYNKNISNMRYKDKKMAIQVNIKTNDKDKNKVDYLQVGEVDRVGRMTGFIYDQAGKNSSATLFVVNDKVVDYEEFKKLPNFKELDEKMNMLVQTSKETHYSKELRMNYVKENLTLTAPGQTYANSKHNFTEMRPVEAGISKFDNMKSLDKNIFTKAKEFVQEHWYKAKDQVQFLLNSKRDLAASNIALALELQQMKVKLEDVKTYQEAVQKQAEKIKEYEQKGVENPNEKANEPKKEYTFAEVFEKLDRAGNLKDNINFGKDLLNDEKFVAQKEAASSILDSIKSGHISISKDEIKAMPANEIKALKVMTDNNIAVNSTKSVKSFVDVLKSATKMSIDQGLDLDSLIKTTLEKLSDKFPSKDKIAENKEKSNDVEVER